MRRNTNAYIKMRRNSINTKVWQIEIGEEHNQIRIALSQNTCCHLNISAVLFQKYIKIATPLFIIYKKMTFLILYLHNVSRVLEPLYEC